jgi:hypothetical protein
VGVYFSRGAAGRRLDVFLVYLMRYLFCKTLTLDVRVVMPRRLWRAG